jgi:hypothetical protein
MWLALLAVLFQALLPAIHHPATLALGGSDLFLASNFCHAPTDIPAHPDDKGPVHRLPPCPLCVSFHHLAGGFTLPSTSLLPLPTAYDLGRFVVADRSGICIGNCGWAHARAPPVKS